jgi:hypothetical protein
MDAWRRLGFLRTRPLRQIDKAVCLALLVHPSMRGRCWFVRARLEGHYTLRALGDPTHAIDTRASFTAQIEGEELHRRNSQISPRSARGQNANRAVLNGKVCLCPFAHVAPT